jgi:aldehyde dehydrogenase (NAD+)
LLISSKPQFVDATSGQFHTLYNPVDDSIVTEKVHIAGSEDVDRAVAAAKTAFYRGPWHEFTGGQRAKCLLKFADLVEQNAARLAGIESLATGIPVAGIQFFDLAHMVEVYKCMLIMRSQRW